MALCGWKVYDVMTGWCLRVMMAFSEGGIVFVRAFVTVFEQRMAV